MNVDLAATRSLEIGKDGAQLFSSALSATELSWLRAFAKENDASVPGLRLTGDGRLSEFLTSSSMARLARKLIGSTARPVRAILFDKKPGSNWALGWHQDRTIAVRERRDGPGFTVWSVKAGIPHVEPPFEFVEAMVTLRAHIDPCGDDNAPLKILLGSHKLGRVAIERLRTVIEASDTANCLAETGDIWAYSTAIIHASDAARLPRRRRVLHVDYSVDDLPHGLEWHGV